MHVQLFEHSTEVFHVEGRGGAGHEHVVQVAEGEWEPPEDAIHKLLENVVGVA